MGKWATVCFKMLLMLHNKYCLVSYLTKSFASGVMTLGVANFPFKILSLVAALPWLEWKGDRPVSKSKVNTPKLHQSAGFPYPGSFKITSGAMYSTETRRVGKGQRIGLNFHIFTCKKAANFYINLITCVLYSLLN